MEFIADTWFLDQQPKPVIKLYVWGVHYQKPMGEPSYNCGHFVTSDEDRVREYAVTNTEQTYGKDIILINYGWYAVPFDDIVKIYNNQE